MKIIHLSAFQYFSLNFLNKHKDHKEIYLYYVNHMKLYKCRVSLSRYPTDEHSTIMCHLACGMIYTRNSFGSRFFVSYFSSNAKCVVYAYWAMSHTRILPPSHTHTHMYTLETPVNTKMRDSFIGRGPLCTWSPKKQARRQQMSVIDWNIPINNL